MEAALVLSRPTPYAALATLDPGMPLPLARELLLHRLVVTTRATQAHLWAGTDRLREIAAWPTASKGSRELTLDQLAALPETKHLQVSDGAVLTLDASRPKKRELAGTADCLRVLQHRDDLQTRFQRQHEHTTQLNGEVLNSSRRLAGIRDLERRRLSSQIANFGRGRLASLQQALDRMLAQPGDTDEITRMRSELNQLSADFRVMVRGIHSSVLQRRGLRAALAEAALATHGQVRIHGSVGSRVDPQLTSSLYFLIAACLETCTGVVPEMDITLEHRAGGVQATVRGLTDFPVSLARAALAVEADQVGMIGGWLRMSSGDGWMTAVVWVPDHLEPLADASLVGPGTFYSTVRSLALRLIAQYAEGPGTAQTRRLLGLMDQPVRMAVVGPPGSAPVQQVLEHARSRRDLVLVAHTPAVPGGADVILSPIGKQVELSLPGAGRLGEGRLEDLYYILTSEVVARADPLRARTALNAMREMIRTTPPPAGGIGPVTQEIETLRIQAEDILRLDVESAVREPLRTG